MWVNPKLLPFPYNYSVGKSKAPSLSMELYYLFNERQKYHLSTRHILCTLKSIWKNTLA
jgi:hypothetical protein